MRRALHPDVARLLWATRVSGARPIEALPPEEARRAYATSRGALQAPFVPVAERQDMTIAGPGGPLALRLFRGPPPGDAPLPCLLYLHGGGWVLGDFDSHEGICRRLAADAGCCVVAVDYRLAPEHPFPAAVEDAAAALRWVAGNAASLGVDGARIAVGGDSAGGNLAAALALMGRDGDAPRSTFQLLLYPVTDIAAEGESYDWPQDTMPVTAAAMRWFIGLYAPDASGRLDWRASPLRAESLAGAPPALVLTCGHDPLCSEGQAYAARLESEGIAVASLHLSDQAHGILTMDGAVGAASAALGFAAAALRDAWRTPARPQPDPAAA